MNISDLSQDLPEDLKNQLNSLRMLAMCHSLLGKAAFPVSVHEQINQGLEFLSILHAQVLEAALQHPDHDKVSELVSLKSSK